MTADTLEARYVRACETGNLGLRARLERELDEATQAANDRLNSPDALLKAALWYARRGVAVFPCEPRGKRPLTAHGLKDATTDADTIRAWWEWHCTGANVGAPTGHLFDVIDLDGREAVGATYGNPDLTFPPAPEIGHALTSRQAGHHVFIAPTGRGNGANILPHVDYRGAGGYVILPPSVGANGRRYVWTNIPEFLR